MLMMISWGTFFSEVLSSCCVLLKGNNTFDGKIIVRCLKLHGCAVIRLSKS